MFHNRRRGSADEITPSFLQYMLPLYG